MSGCVVEGEVKREGLCGCVRVWLVELLDRKTKRRDGRLARAWAWKWASGCIRIWKGKVKKRVMWLVVRLGLRRKDEEKGWAACVWMCAYVAGWLVLELERKVK